LLPMSTLKVVNSFVQSVQISLEMDKKELKFSQLFCSKLYKQKKIIFLAKIQHQRNDIKMTFRHKIFLWNDVPAQKFWKKFLVEDLVLEPFYSADFFTKKKIIFVKSWVMLISFIFWKIPSPNSQVDLRLNGMPPDWGRPAAAGSM
jgi:hypothetical protein